MRSIRAKSLLIDLLFTPIPFPHRDDARSLIPRCVGYDNQAPGQQAQGDETFFPISKAVVFEGDARPGKDLLGILEAETVLSEVLLFLRLVPFVFHSCFAVDCSSFCSYAQGGWATNAGLSFGIH